MHPVFIFYTLGDSLFIILIPSLHLSGASHLVDCAVATSQILNKILGHGHLRFIRTVRCHLLETFQGCLPKILRILLKSQYLIPVCTLVRLRLNEPLSLLRTGKLGEKICLNWEAEEPFLCLLTIEVTNISYDGKVSMEHAVYFL